MSAQQSLKQFFASKIFEVPKYQRSYAWERQNVNELFTDIKEALDTKSNHYVGTVVLAKTDRDEVFNIVDGQQRLTTIVLFISVIIRQLEDQEDRDFYRRYYIKERGNFKLTPLERDKNFYFSLLEGDASLEPQSKSQRFLLEAHGEMENIIKVSIPDPLQFLKAIETLSMLEFIEKNESDAIRIFQTVNDRGRDLSRMDKMKSLLFYYSNKYLGGEYDNDINVKFGEIFELYDDIKQCAEKQGINSISSRQFSEDDLLRQHHICFSAESYDPTAQQVLDNVKSALSSRRTPAEVPRLASYIKAYLDSLLVYIQSFSRVIGRTQSDPKYYKLFSILGMSTVLYPVIGQMEKHSLLDQTLPTKQVRVLDMIEIIDVRVLKIREYAGKKHLAEFAFDLNSGAWSIDRIENYLVWFNAHEISNDRFRDYLSGYSYYKQTGLMRLLFIDYCERLKNKIYSIDDLKAIMDREPTLEHILSQSPKFKPRAFGFRNEEEYEEHKELIGNLTLLEKSINSSIKNADLVDKIPGYGKSRFKMTNLVATELAMTSSFKKADLIERGVQLVEDFSKRWWA